MKIKLRKKEIALLALFLFPSLVRAEVTQNTSYLNTDTKNRGASDQSLQHSTVYAMNALMDLGNLNVKSAVNNGMTAYGKYRNAETLDKLGDQNVNLAASMSSVGSATVAPRKTDTTFRRLDPSFLSQGQFADVASQFEKKSGMPRTQFLSQMSDISEQKIKRSDPQLVDKVVGRFESFISKIPNKDFQASLQKGVNMVPASARTGLISQAVAKFSGMIAGTPSASSDISTAAKAPDAAAPAASAADAEKAQEAADAAKMAALNAPVDTARDPASTAPSSLTPSSSTGSPDTANPLGNIIQAAIDTQAQDPTIFQQVTRRYRIVTPALVGKPL